MQNDSIPLKVLLVAEGSGGHLIPALQVAKALVRSGARIKVWYAQRQPIAALATALSREASDGGVEIDPIPVPSSRDVWGRLWRCGQLWSKASRCFDTFAPDVVVGFGGWVSAPVVLAARTRRIGCLLHEQNVVLGRTNRWLARWVDQVALSFGETQQQLPHREAVITGMPVREMIGQSRRAEAAASFGLDPQRLTLLVLGGSQGARAINWLICAALADCASEERQGWQVVHIAGPADEDRMRQAYDASGISAHVAAFVVNMEQAYALADVAVARAGASTVAELTRCGVPAIFIPYPHAGAHQRANAKLVESVGGGICIEESEATSERLLASVRQFLGDARLRQIMGQQLRTLHTTGAAERLRDAIVEIARHR
ncbi:MAG: undecaprenyldiphospho-muramoylpentapeptide beta-N-acetylglucosaminyltransferase [Candidatus Omnitrophica bacterium CG11_big_fil_rev_8_21_14_0_20_63_9]|nr:MAG: undecaprenyldiphospho-muramoylpentapeptide beta-N-acetylglucosaminyltransferase [Candidatus Omnitrophica bacterium CG11_big_fil_rev_8_21_14_0_20_63_9]